MYASGIASGHVLAADWLFLIAAILFVIAAIVNFLGGTILAKVNPLTVTFVGLALFAFAFVLL